MNFDNFYIHAATNQTKKIPLRSFPVNCPCHPEGQFSRGTAF